MLIISYIYQKTIVQEKKRRLQSQLLESFVCYRVIDLVESYVYYISQNYILEDIYQNLLYCYGLWFYICQKFMYLFIYLYIYLICLFQYLINYIVYRKEQSKIRGKSRGRTGTEYDRISQIIKKKCYL